MKYNFILVALLGATYLFSQELSTFKSQNSQANILNNLQTDLTQAEQNIEGLQSVVTGLSQNNQKQNVRLNDLENSIKNDINTQLAQILQVQKEQSEQIQKLKEALVALGASLKENSPKQASSTQNKTSLQQTTDKNSKQKSAVNTDFNELKTMMEQAEKDFKAKKYDVAKSTFEYLIENNYKPAFANYMLGEIAYANKQYKEAIPYYKASVNLYNKSLYMPRLLYHTAISCDKIGDRENANKFYSALKQAYPDSPEAKVSPTRK